MKKALVIDDSRDAADTIVKMLSLLNVEAHAAYGPRAAMTLVKGLTPDIVFLDINMPGVDGFEVLSFLRRFPESQDVPIVMVTSDDQPETTERVREMGALLVIIKPASVDALELALRKAGLYD